MNIVHKKNGLIDCVSLCGNLVMATAEMTRQRLKKIVDSGATQLIVNMSGVDLIDSSGLSVLVGTLKTIDAKNGSLILTSITPRSMAILKLMRLNEVFQILSSDEVALEGLGSPLKSAPEQEPLSVPAF